MSGMSSIHLQTKEKFCRAFGDPHRAQGHDLQWSLRSLAYLAPINILLDLGNHTPIVWIFDPHDIKEGVFHLPLRSEADADSVIWQIEQRLQTSRGGP